MKMETIYLITVKYYKVYSILKQENLVDRIRGGQYVYSR